MDINSVKIANRYADALIALGNYDKISADLNFINEVLAQNPDFFALLDSPSLSVEKRIKLADEIFNEQVDLKTLNFLKVLIENGRFGCFEEAYRAYFEALDRVNNLVRIQVTSAIPLDDHLRWKLDEKLKAKLQKNIYLDFITDESIIAGLVIKIGDRIIDTSLKTRIKQFEKQLT